MKPFNMGRVAFCVTTACNMHCRNCMRNRFIGAEKSDGMTVDEIRTVLKELNRESLVADMLVIGGGESLLHPELGSIVDVCFEYGFNKLEMVTNGTLFTPRNVKILTRFKSLCVSVYPTTRELVTEFMNGPVAKYLKRYLKIKVRDNPKFAIPSMDVPGDPNESWENCSQRQKCRTLRPFGVYLCTGIEQLERKQDACPYDREQIEQYFRRSEPFEVCKNCGISLNKLRYEPHESEKPVEDAKVIERGFRNLRETAKLLEEGEGAIVTNNVRVKEVTSWQIPKEIFHSEDGKMLGRGFSNEYSTKYRIASECGANRILEIGVRRGYSAYSFLSACPDATYVGLDILEEVDGGVTDGFEWAEKILSGFDVLLLNVDTQRMRTIFAGKPFDLVHVDGLHTVEGAFHDMELFWSVVSVGGIMLVDDYDYIGKVKEAVKRFELEEGVGYEYIKSFRGNALFRKGR